MCSKASSYYSWTHLNAIPAPQSKWSFRDSQRENIFFIGAVSTENHLKIMTQPFFTAKDHYP